MKTIIAGDRECDNIDLIELATKESGFEITEIVSGGARGADKCGEIWAKIHDIPVKVFCAEWNNLKQSNANIKTRTNPWNKKKEKYNSNAGFYRNEEMAKYADALIALQPQGPTPGTTHMIKMAKKYGLKIYIYENREYDYDF